MFIFSFKQQVLNEKFSPVSFLSDLYLYTCTCTRRISLLLVQGFQNSVPLLEIQQTNNKCMERTSKEVSFSVKFTTLGSRVVVFWRNYQRKGARNACRLECQNVKGRLKNFLRDIFLTYVSSKIYSILFLLQFYPYTLHHNPLCSWYQRYSY